jgi:hypothetical protein
MKTVWKYPLKMEVFTEQPVEVPSCAKLVHVGWIGNSPALWFEVDSEERVKEARHFVVYGTGRQMGDGVHRGTVINDGYVWHIYEVFRA